MASKEVHELTASAPLEGSELVHCEQDGNSRKTTARAIARTGLEWAPNVTGDAYVCIPAAEAMTVDQGNAPIGTADISFEASTAAAPDTFAAAVLPVALEAGAWLKVSFANVDTFAAAHLVRIS